MEKIVTFYTDNFEDMFCLGGKTLIKVTGMLGLFAIGIEWFLVLVLSITYWQNFLKLN